MVNRHMCEARELAIELSSAGLTQFLSRHILRLIKANGREHERGSCSEGTHECSLKLRSRVFVSEWRGERHEVSLECK